MKYACENCGCKITKEEYLEVDIMKNALCKECKKLNKKQREVRARKMFERKKEYERKNYC